jgi:hypothetical protein
MGVVQIVLLADAGGQAGGAQTRSQDSFPALDDERLARVKIDSETRTEMSVVHSIDLWTPTS